MAGNSAKEVEFFNGSTYMKAVLVEEAPDEGALCFLCGKPLHGSPFYTTEPHIFDVHLRCAENIYRSPPQNNMYGNVNYHAQPHPFYHQPPNPYYQQQPPFYHQQPPNPYYQQQPPFYHQPPNPYYQQQPPFYHHQLPNPYYQHPPNPYYQHPPNPYYQQQPPYGSTSKNQRPVLQSTAVGILGSYALSAFLQALFGIILPIPLPFGNN